MRERGQDEKRENAQFRRSDARDSVSQPSLEGPVRFALCSRVCGGRAWPFLLCLHGRFMLMLKRQKLPAQPLLLMLTSGGDDLTLFGQLICHFLINVY